MMKINLEGFQPCDIRGLYGETAEAQISPLHAFLIGKALRQILPEGKQVLLAGDGRDSTPRLMRALEQGIGLFVRNLGNRLPTPSAYLGKKILNSHTLAVVTASHNPSTFNGIKIQVGDWPITPELLKSISDEVAASKEQEYIEDVDRSIPESVAKDRERIWKAYKAAVAKAFPRFQELPIVVDCMHGCYSSYARELLTEMGFLPTMLRDRLSTDFFGIEPDPARDRNIQQLAKTVGQGDFAFGVALDGDGDRARFVDETGRPLDNATMLVLLVQYALEFDQQNPLRKVVYDQKLRLAAIHALREIGANPVMEKSGHAFIRTRMLKEDALFGGEISGHFFWGADTAYPVAAGDCGLFAACAVGDLLRRKGKRLSELASRVAASPCYTGDIRGLRVAGNREELLSEMAAKVDRSIYEVFLTDGMRLETPDSFAHIRPSVTESDMLTAVFDAMNARKLQRIAEDTICLFPKDALSLSEPIRQRIGEIVAR